MTSYKPLTKPRKHQAAALEAHALKRNWGHRWEQGTGKTKQTIDTAGVLYDKGEIELVIVVAPNGVHTNWATEELPKHMSDKLYRSYVYHSTGAKTKKAKQRLRTFMRTSDGRLRWLMMSYDAVKTQNGAAVFELAMKTWKTLLVFDESSVIKNPKALITKMMVGYKQGRTYVPGLAPLAAYRRFLNGTISGNSSLDVWAQVEAIDSTFWNSQGIRNFFAFRCKFAVTKKIEVPSGKTAEIVVGYKNLEQLAELLEMVSDRVTKDEVLDLPPKVYQKHRFVLSPEERRIYNDVTEELEAKVQDLTGKNGKITVKDALSLLLRQQQVTSGFMPLTYGEDPDEKPTLARISKKSSRLAAFEALVENMFRKTIVFARFRDEIDQLMELLGDKAVRHDGSVKKEDREIAKTRFRKDPSVQFFVANQPTAARGLTLTEAKVVIYYSNEFRLDPRLQSEDRAHRDGQDQSVLYIDLIADNTIDEDIVQALIDHKEVADIIQGDPQKLWLKGAETTFAEA